jgi:hypothetical protein
MSQTKAKLSSDEVFHLLSSPRRRFVLYYLHTEQRTVDLSEVVAEVAAWENDKQVEELTEKERKRMYVSLYQTHIPKLAAAGLIEYDTDEQVVAPTGRISQVAPYFEKEATGPDWYLFYFVGAMLNISILTTGTLGPQWAQPLGNVVFPLTLGLLVLIATAHFIYVWQQKNKTVGLVDEAKG